MDTETNPVTQVEPAQEPVAKIKNPKRVTAGKKAAAARNAKHLAELANIKASLHTEEQPVADPQPVAPHTWAGPVFYIAGGMGIAGVIYFVVSHLSQPVAQQQPVVPDVQLKFDPHVML